MRNALPDRSRSTNPLRLALAQLALLSVAFALVDASLLDRLVAPYWVVALLPATGLVYVAAGVIAWTRRPSNRMGPLLCAGGLVFLVAGLVNTTSAPLVAAGLVVSTTMVAVLLHVLLAFPSGRLRGPVSRGLVVAGYLVYVVLQAPLYLFTDPTRVGNPLQVADRPDLYAIGANLQNVAGTLVMVGATAVLVRRLRVESTPAGRRVLGPLYLFGILAVLTISFSAALARLVPLDAVGVFVLQLIVLAAVPPAFVTAVLLGGFARTAAIEELAAWLGTAQPRRGELGAALARTLGDPTLCLAFRADGVAGSTGWVDHEGAALPAAGSDRAVVPVELGGQVVGAIRYDASLLSDADVVHTVGRVVAIAVDHERLTAQLLAGQEQLRDSRNRLVQAGDRERRRLAQDLHDRLQGRLVLLTLRAGSLSAKRSELEVGELRHGLDEAISELRSIVQGVMPSLLIERGLVAAIEDMIERLPLRTVLDLFDDHAGVRLPESVEIAGYSVVAEAVTNTVKHAAAGELRIGIRREDGTLRIELRDDGVGGATLGGGAGLRGIADRVDALGGQVYIDSPAGAGTLIRVELPCGS